MQSNNLKILLTGGHAGSTAYSVIQSLIDIRKNLDIYWIGVANAFEGKSAQTFEKRVFPGMGVNFVGIKAGKLQTKLTAWTFVSILKIPLGLFQAIYQIYRINPDIVVSFGGFASVPVVIAAWIFKVPIIIHEQTMAGGRANQFSGVFAKKIVLARKESIPYFNSKKTVVLGNPISKEILSVKPKTKINNPPTLFVMGGSRGSELINNILMESASKILKFFKVIHQTGEFQYREVDSFRKRLSTFEKSRYKIFGFAMPSQMKDFYNESDIVISRAGANTVWEVMATGRPAIFIPLSIADKNEQYKNASYAERFGVARIITEDVLENSRLLTEINYVTKNWNNIVKNVLRNKNIDLEASMKFAKLILNEAEIK